MSPAPALLIVLAYLIGSIPFSFLVTRILTRQDVRNLGSGNVGATNVLRNAGKGAGLLALALDLAKGYGAVWIAAVILQSDRWPWALVGKRPMESESLWIGLAASLAVLGHLYPIWLGFRGGKGVATATGAFLAIAPLSIAFALLVFFGVVFTTRYVSVASMSAAAALPLIMRFGVGAPFWTVVFTIVIVLMVILKHHENISRLVEGTERKLGEKDN